MQLIQIAPKRTRIVDLHWSRPIPYEKIITEGSNHDTESWLYMILGYSRSPDPKLFYVGKVYQTCVSARLRQADHKQRYERLCKEHPRHTFRVSLGAIDIGGHMTDKKVDEIETMLIYTAKEAQPLINERKWMTHGISRAYHIRNHGSRRPLPQEIFVGIFVR